MKEALKKFSLRLIIIQGDAGECIAKRRNVHNFKDLGFCIQRVEIKKNRIQLSEDTFCITIFFLKS